MRPTQPATIAAALWPDTSASVARYSRFAILALAGTLVLAVSAKAQVPFYPVPLTLQTLVVLVLGAAYGGRLAGATVALYLVEGAIGLPVFAGTPEKGLGLAYMMGPTGGFLAGFLFAAALVGWCAERGWDRSIIKLTAVMAAGHAVIFAFGLSWLAYLIGWNKAWIGGAEPFIIATGVKTLLAAAIVPALWKIMPRKD